MAGANPIIRQFMMVSVGDEPKFPELRIYKEGNQMFTPLFELAEKSFVPGSINTYRYENPNGDAELRFIFRVDAQKLGVRTDEKSLKQKKFVKVDAFPKFEQVLDEHEFPPNLDA
ncbi:MAG: hypothetical protein K9G62_09020 [Alphaproteobacteria bacterium]|nr:hypothetical protein [Alphaproteobacteria bacterium]